MSRARLWHRTAGGVVVLSLIGCGADPVDTPPVTLDVPLQRATLRNGLELVVAPNHLVPVVTALVAFHAGAFEEDDATNGTAHLFEHMMFDGSDDVPDPIEFRDRLEALGVRSNATTDVDAVTYFFAAETSHLDAALGLFSGALRRPALLDEQLERERQVVFGEFDLNEADYDFVRRRRMLQELYRGYVSRMDALGSRNAVGAATSDDLRRAHDTYYVPNNAVLVLSGDVSMKDARTLAEGHFGDWERAPDPIREHPPPSPEQLRGNRYAVLEAPITDTRISIGWMCPAAKDDSKGTLAGQLLSEVTYLSDHSFRQLQGPGDATSARLDFISHRYSSYVSVQIILPQGREDQVLAIARDSLRVIATPGDVTREQLGVAKDALFKGHFYAADSPDRLAHGLADHWGLEGIESYETHVDDVYAVGLGDLDRLARTCVRGQPHAVVLQSSPDNLAAAGIDAAYLESWL